VDGTGVLVARSGTALLRRVFDMPCPYWRNGKERYRACAKHLRSSRCSGLGTGRNACATERQLRKERYRVARQAL